MSALAEMYVQGVSTRKVDDDCRQELRWLEDHRYLNMDYLKEQKTELMQTAA